MEDEEEASSTAAVSSASATPTSSELLSPASAPSTVVWTIGARLESKARDSNGGEQWFPAKVLDVDSERVLVHYMQWNARHDEWIPSNSSRLRPVTTSGSGRSSRHNSGGDRTAAVVENIINDSNDMNTIAVSPVTLPAHKDFKPGDKVMATWKLNRKYLATVRKYESSDGTYLVEFYDGVTMNVKPNNMRRPRKGEDDILEQESLKINGVDNESAENSEAEEHGSNSNNTNSTTQSSSSARRERKRKFDVKQLLNIRTVKSLRSNSQEDTVEVANTSNKNEKRKRRLVSQQKSNSSTATPNVLNGCKVKPKLEDGPALAAVSGKRERRKKKFWDDEVDSLSAISSSSTSTSSKVSPTTPAAAAASSSTTSSSTSSALKRKSSVSSVSSSSKKLSKKSSEKTSSQSGDNAHSNDQDLVKPNGSGPHHNVPEHLNTDSSSKQQPSGKENGKLLPYLQFDLNENPEIIAEKMIEGVNIPGMGQPIPVDSSSLPEGWEKRVIQRRIGITKGKWDVFITNPETGKSFRSKTELQKHLDERKLPYTSDAFDFSLDDNLKKLRQIWKQYKVKPFLNNPKGTANTNYRHVPAKITQVSDSDILAASGGHNRGGSHHSASVATSSSLNSSSAGVAPSIPEATASGTSASLPTLSSSAMSNNLKQNNSPPLQPNEVPEDNWAGLAEIAVESETGQGLRCSINKCGKLFRNNRLLRQHVKHYHPKIYDTLVCKHPGIGADDISEPTSPEAAVQRRWSESVDQDGGGQENHGGRRRKPSAEVINRRTTSENVDAYDYIRSNSLNSGSSIKKHRTLKRSTLDEEAPLSSMYDDDEEVFFNKRTRNDSVPSSVNSDAEDISVSGDHSSSHSYHHYQQQQSYIRSSSGSAGVGCPSASGPNGGPQCPPTPPTFRLSKRRQAQMRKRVAQPIIRMSKIEDTPLGRDYREELLNLANSTTSVASPNPGLSAATSPNGSVQDMNNQPQSYPPSEMDASVADSEHLTSEELVNCTCRRLEEDGLMIQCDICLCWQHGYCVGIEDEDPVPEKHVCETCRQPAGGRSDARFSLDQDWLKEGKLPSIEMCSTKKKSSLLVAANEKETAFRKLSELMADLSHLDKILHGLRVKLHVASQPNNNKVFMWSSVWSLPTVVQSSMELEEEPVPPLPPASSVSSSTAIQQHHPNHFSQGMLLEATTVATSSKDQPNGQAVDPQAVADKLNLIKEEDEHTNGPSYDDAAEESAKESDVVANDKTSQVTENSKNSDDDDHETVANHSDDKNESAIDPAPPTSKASDLKQQAYSDQKTSPDDVQHGEHQGDVKQTIPTPPLTNGNKGLEEDNKVETETKSETETNSSNNHIQEQDPTNVQDLQGLDDASFIPSVYEVERLLPSVLQAMEATKDPTVPKPSTSKTAVIIPEPKRLDRDECRLNLLTHIESVQGEIEKRFTAIEEALKNIENMPGAFHAGLTPAQLQVGESKIKSKLTMLIQDLAIARQLTWTL